VIRFPAHAKEAFYQIVQTGYEVHSPFSEMITMGPSTKVKRVVVLLAVYMQLVPRLRERGAVTSILYIVLWHNAY